MSPTAHVPVRLFSHPATLMDRSILLISLLLLLLSLCFGNLPVTVSLLAFTAVTDQDGLPGSDHSDYRKAQVLSLTLTFANVSLCPVYAAIHTRFWLNLQTKPFLVLHLLRA